MRHGTTVRTVAEGAVISESRLKTIGIYHGSVSWAVWLFSLEEKDPHHPDLLISSLHPDSWPHTFRLTLRLKNEIGSLAQAADLLREEGVNILSARSSVSGHHHATWNVIGEALPLREALEAKGRSFLKSPDESARDRVAADLARGLLVFLDTLLKTLDSAEFLHPRFVEKQLLSFKAEEIRSENWDVWNDTGLWERIGDQRSRAVACSVLPVLTYLWRKGVTDLRSQGGGHSSRLRASRFSERGLEPLQFKYEQEAGMLRSLTLPRFGSELNDLDVEVPGVAVASFDTDEHFLRLRFFKEEERRKLYHIDTDYHRSFGAERTTKGLIESVTRQVKDKRINLVQVSNSISAQTPGEEAGGLRFIVELPKEPSPPAVIDLESELKKDMERRFDDLEAEVRMLPVSPGRIFLSRHENLKQKAPLKAIREIARAFGLESVEARTLVSGVTENAVKELRSCQGLAQVWGQRKEGGESEIQWLIGEYAIAVALGIPSIRIVDLDVKTKQEWKDFLRWDQDRELITYCSSWDDEDIRKHLGAELPSFFQAAMRSHGLPRAAG